MPTAPVTGELIWHVHQQVIPAALSLLPGQMSSPEARAMLIAIGLQESAFNARMQGGRGTRRGTGPAAGFFQFERNGGVREILESADTKDYALPICRMFLYEPTPVVIHRAIADHDVLATVFARLLLWRDPRPMAGAYDSEKGWRIYVDRWRPGRPHPQTWPGHFNTAWGIVGGQ